MIEFKQLDAKYLTLTVPSEDLDVVCDIVDEFVSGNPKLELGRRIMHNSNLIKVWSYVESSDLIEFRLKKILEGQDQGFLNNLEEKYELNNTKEFLKWS